MDLFCGLKNLFWLYFFVFQPTIYVGRWDLPKNALDLVNLGPQSTVCNLRPNIWSHHPALDFHTQIARKHSTAMCYIFGILTWNPTTWLKQNLCSFLFRKNLLQAPCGYATRKIVRMRCAVQPTSWQQWGHIFECTSGVYCLNLISIDLYVHVCL